MSDIENLIKRYLKYKIFMDDDWFSKPNKERDIVIPDFIKTEIQTFNKERRCIAMMFARIFKKFNFYPHPVKFDIKMYIDDQPEKIPLIPNSAYQQLVNKFENKTKGDIDAANIKTICEQTFKYNNRIEDIKIYTLKHHVKEKPTTTTKKSTLLNNEDIDIVISDINKN